MTDSDSSRVRRKKSRELWSTNNKVVHVSLETPKSEDHISAQIFTRAIE